MKSALVTAKGCSEEADDPGVGVIRMRVSKEMALKNRSLKLKQYCGRVIIIGEDQFDANGRIASEVNA